jgi:hypothetical protein
MENKRLFEYAVIRVVPRVEREEFMNVGVILYCAEENFLGVQIQLDVVRLQAFAPKLNIAEVEASLHSLVRISQGDNAAGAIAQYNTAERFRWLTAQRSTIIQCSCVHPGLCADAATTLQHLFQQLVDQ